MTCGSFVLFAALVLGSAGPDRVSAAGLHYRLEGSGPDVVLIHGFHTDLREWDDVARVLAASRRVLRYDVRGHGRSAPASEPRRSGDDLYSLLDELGIRKATIVGLSMGATIAAELALTHPDRVERLILLSAALPGMSVAPPMDWMAPIAAAVRAGDPSRAAELWWESPLLAGVRRPGAGAARQRAIVLENAKVWTVPTRPPALDPPPGARLVEFTMPVLAVAGALDAPAFAEAAKTIAASVPRGRYEIVADAGHMISMERPDAVVRLVSSAR